MKKFCKHCKYEWDSRKDEVKQCPYCKSYKWNMDVKETAKDMNKILNGINKGLTGGSK